MRPYRCFLFTRDGRISGVDLFESVDDDDARTVGERMRQEKGCHAIEVWDRSRLVTRCEGANPSETNSTGS